MWLGMTRDLKLSFCIFVPILYQTPASSFLQSSETRSPEKSMKSPGFDRDTQKKVEETNQALKQLQADFTSYKKEKLENEKYDSCCYNTVKQL